MIRINLLPHREQKRKARLRRFAFLSAMSFAAGFAVVAAAYTFVQQEIANQEERNAFLKGQNELLDKQIAEIETLKKERQALLDRKKVVERLQSNRSEAVHILDQLVRQTPEGVYLREIKQTDDQLVLNGYTQSNARVSTFMRSLNDSPIFEQPTLIEIKATPVGNKRLSEFNLRVKVTRAQAEEETKPGQAKKDGAKQDGAKPESGGGKA
ncbi:PilN domain-containing protein [Parachitinimonas caeni]|uniref:PilN domain-containing protein n=1 Tax=Parachitinimonas caeni TaxID=3031301 RepID=A0ABT7DSD0_9NEIS|nr:PilN domain-containing protein [Parachitinimonas caeni]MDK2122971.1 PilN domain-containing protein [Parachitinimonas caeni]